MKKEFLDFVNALMEAAPEVAQKLMTENVKAYMEALVETKTDKPELTDNGKMILKYLQDHSVITAKSKEVAEGLFMSSRAVSGAMRKLVNDGFLEKVGTDPVIYALTEKGKNYNFED